MALNTTGHCLHCLHCLLLVVIVLETIFAQCPPGTTMSFEKISAVTVRGVPLYPLFSSQLQETPVTAECNNRCRAGPKCRAFLLNYDKSACVGMDYDSLLTRSQSLVSTNERTTYFEKVCLASAPCEKAWTFERVMGRELQGFDDRVLNGVASRLRCQEMCLKERQFKCKSGEYDYAQQQCRLSAEDRRSQPKAFRASSSDYFENECAPLSEEASRECQFSKHEGVDIKRADLVRNAHSSDQCRHLCDQTRAFLCRSFSFSEEKKLCFLSSDDSIDGVIGLESQVGVNYYQRTNCLDLQLLCNSDSMTVSLNTLEAFSGKIYAKEEPTACEAVGRSKTTTLLTLPFARSECGVREERGRYSSVVVIQNHPLIQRKGDRVVQVTCHFETVNKTIMNSFSVIQDSPQSDLAVVNASAPSPEIRLRITDETGNDVTGAKLGQELFLRIELEDESVFGILARDLVAKSGKTDESIFLIDSEGCPVDRTIFPELEREKTSKVLLAKFDAFKFADDNVVRFQVNVQFCLQECQPVNCSLEATSGGVKSYGRRKRREEPSGGVLPDYPLQREIIVEGMAKGEARQSQPITREPQIFEPIFHQDTLFEGPEDPLALFCTSRSTLIVALITLITLQLTIIGSCCACAMIYRKSRCLTGSPSKGDSESIATSEGTRDHLFTQSRGTRHALFSQMTRMD